MNTSRKLLVIRSLLALIFLSVATTSCRDEFRSYAYPDEANEETETAENSGEYTITLDIPDLHVSNGTRALTKEQEADAANVQVLVFDVPNNVSNDQETYSYTARIITKPILKNGKYVMKIRLNQATDNQRLILLANLPGDKLPTGLQKGATKAQVYQLLTYSYSAQGWKSDGEKTGAKSGTDYDLIPMWGESNAIPVGGAGVTVDFGDYHYQDGVIRLYRALARVDVGVAFDAPTSADASLPESNRVESAASRDFDFKEIYVYRPAMSYRLAGDITTIKSEDRGRNYKPTTPVLPTNVQFYTTKSSTELQKHTIDPDQAKSVRTIYIPESPVTTANNVRDQLEQSTCIVIGGVYKGNNYNPKGRENTELSYYRIDFVKTEVVNDENKTTLLPILRNHRYRINVVKIDGPGHKTPKDAIENTSKDVIYNVKVWDETDISQVITDGRYWLRLNKDVIRVGKIGGDIPIKFETNWEKGWELIIPKYLKYTADGKPAAPNTPNPLLNDTYYNQKEWVRWISSKDRTDMGRSIQGKSSTTGMETKEEEVIFRIGKLPTLYAPKTYQKRYGEFVVQTKGGRLNWTIGVHQNPTIDIELELYDDREMTTQINFIQIHEEGYNWDKTITVDKRNYTPVDQGSYKTFYVRALPYGTNYVPEITSDGGGDFLFWDYESYPGGPQAETLPLDNATKKYFKKLSEFTNKHKALKYLDADNLWEVTISANKMTAEHNPFELLRNKYHFTLAINDGTDKESVTRDINLLQEEYNVRFYKDSELTKMVMPREMVYLMDGATEKLYIKSNLPYTLWINDFQPIGDFKRSARHGRTVLDSKNKFTAEFFPIWKGPGIYGTQSAGGDYSSSFTSNLSFRQASSGNLSGDPVEISLRDDFSDPAVILAWSEWKMTIENPLYAYKLDGVIGASYDGQPIKGEDQNIKRDTRYIGLMAAVPQPEANSYFLGLGQGGIMIPLSRINTAANFYNNNIDEPGNWLSKWDNQGTNTISSNRLDPLSEKKSWAAWKQEHALYTITDEDKISVDVLWTDCEMKEDNKVPVGTGQPLTVLNQLDWNGERYILVIPGPTSSDYISDNEVPDLNEGNIVIVARGMSERFKRVNLTTAAGQQVSDTYKQYFGDEKPILWSWHLIVRNPMKQRLANQKIGYRMPLEIDLQPRPNSDNRRRFFMDRCLGAIDKPEKYRYGIYIGAKRRQLPLFYQNQRKDPFPQHDNTLKGQLAQTTVNAPAPFHGKDGKPFNFLFIWPATISMRQSIENPSLYVGSANQYQWMTEGSGDQENMLTDHDAYLWQNAGIWGGVQRFGSGGDSNQRWQLRVSTSKTPFDPSPYGFKVPAMGVESSFYFEGVAAPTDFTKGQYDILKLNWTRWGSNTGNRNNYWSLIHLDDAGGGNLTITSTNMNASVVKYQLRRSHQVETKIINETSMNTGTTLAIHTTTAFSNSTYPGVLWFEWSKSGAAKTGSLNQFARSGAGAIRPVQNDAEYANFRHFFNWDPQEFVYNWKTRHLK